MSVEAATSIHHAAIRGRVQGVGYRAWVEYEALKRGLEGWVRNRRDGSVEAVFAGSPEAVAEMIAVCRQGPPVARVEAIEQRAGQAADLAPRRPGERFSVLPTA
jgi:acylphosphatase